MPRTASNRFDYVPSYVQAYEAGLLRERVDAALELLKAPCHVCPRYCKVNRLQDEHGACLIGRYAVVASAFPHFGEEDVLRGWMGSGTIFMSGCNLRCVFCQNYDISQVVSGTRVTPEQLAALMLRLQELGCHNINIVTPEHVVPQVVEALYLAVQQGLRLPLVYNTSAYDSRESLQVLDGLVDIYMPDFKVWTHESARRYLKSKEDYAEVARESIREMHRQVGDLQIDELGLAYRGLLLRHLMMPGLVEETKAILHWIAETLGPNTYVNLMAQYYPANKVGESYPEINRSLYREEYIEAVEYAESLGLRLDRRSVREGLLLPLGRGRTLSIR
ncbi:MAG: radical SAM protein [Fimbriimonadales bacterium]|nr:radical SAM protein [Fimbriimonadales bacterium]